MDGSMLGQTDAQTERQTDRWTDGGQMYVCRVTAINKTTSQKIYINKYFATTTTSHRKITLTGLFHLFDKRALKLQQTTATATVSVYINQHTVKLPINAGFLINAGVLKPVFS